MCAAVSSLLFARLFDLVWFDLIWLGGGRCFGFVWFGSVAESHYA